MLTQTIIRALPSILQKEGWEVQKPHPSEKRGKPYSIRLRLKDDESCNITIRPIHKRHGMIEISESYLVSITNKEYSFSIEIYNPNYTSVTEGMLLFSQIDEKYKQLIGYYYKIMNGEMVHLIDKFLLL